MSEPMNDMREEIEVERECPRCKGVGTTEEIGFSSAGDMDSGDEPHKIRRSCYICKRTGKIPIPADELVVQLKAALLANREKDAQLERMDAKFLDLLEQLASLRAGEKPEDAWKRGFIEGVRESALSIVPETIPKLREVSDAIYDNILDLKPPLYVAPPSTEKDS